jgi:hypothetical protein
MAVPTGAGIHSQAAAIMPPTLQVRLPGWHHDAKLSGSALGNRYRQPEPPRPNVVQKGMSKCLARPLPRADNASLE